MDNKILAGRFAGDKVRVANGQPYIRVGYEQIFLSSEIVDHISLVNIIQNKSFLNGWFRGMFAKLLGNTAWLSAIQSASNKCLYNIKISYRDGTASVGTVDFNTLETLVVICNFR